jgi:DNA invertase Pin-like site-specific DNA recombinase
MYQFSDLFKWGIDKCAKWVYYALMPKRFERSITVYGKRPSYATPELARKLKEEGKSVKQIAIEWGITRAQVYNILKQA